jgi:hypothetical protein
MNSVFSAQLPTLNKIEEYVFTNTTLGTKPESQSIAQSFDTVWKIAMDGNLYKLVCSIGLLIAIFAVGFWCVKFYISLEEGGYRPAVNEMIFPLVLIVLLSNGGANMRDATVATRNVLNNVNESVNKVVSMDIDMRTAIKTLATHEAVKDTLTTMFNSCYAKPNLNEFGGCVQSRKIAAQNLVRKAGSTIQNSGNAAFQAQLSIWEANWQQTANVFSSIVTPEQALVIPQIEVPKDNTNTTNDTGPLDSPIIGKPNSGTPTPTGASSKNTPDVFTDRSVYSSDASKRAINTTIMSFRTAFLYVIEVMMLVTALIGPIFVALSMFPIGTKPLLAWGTSFLSLGFCKICFSLISGLSAIAFVYTDPDKIDMTVVAVVLGLLAPVLSFGIASGSGIGALNNIATVSQNFGINPGTGYYNPNVGNGLSDKVTPTIDN